MFKLIILSCMFLTSIVSYANYVAFITINNSERQVEEHTYPIRFSLKSPNGYDYFGKHISINGNNAIIGNSGHFFKFDGKFWVEQQKLNVGDSSAVNDNTAIISYGNGMEPGAAHIYKFEGSNWVKNQVLRIDDSYSSYYFGSSISLSNDTIVVGASGGDGPENDQGSAYVYRFNGVKWAEEQKLSPSNPSSNDSFGNSMAILDNTLVIGANMDEDRKGAAYVFKFDGNEWVEQQKLRGSDVEQYDYFGSSIAMSNDRIIIGSSTYSGSAYIYKFDGKKWVEEQKISSKPSEQKRKSSYTSFSEVYPISLAIQENTAILGNQSIESVTVFNFNGSYWIENQRLKSPTPQKNDYFGSSVAISHDTVIVGAYGEDKDASNSGAVYVFKLQ